MVIQKKEGEEAQMEGDPDTVCVNIKCKDRVEEMVLPSVLPICSFQISFLASCVLLFPDFSWDSPSICLLYQENEIPLAATLEEIGVKEGDILEVVTH